MDFYIYYRVRSEQTCLLLQRVRALQSQLQRDYGVQPLLKRRPESRDGLQTWMEVYPGLSEQFDSVLTQAAAEAGLTSLIEGERHVERFMDVEDSAGTTACA